MLLHDIGLQIEMRRISHLQQETFMASITGLTEIADGTQMGFRQN